MKKIILSITAAAALLFTSCSDFLEVNPPTTIPSETAIQTVEDAQAAIHGLYDILQRVQYYNQYYLIYGDIRADDIQADNSSQVSYHFYVFNHAEVATISSNFGLMWFNPMHLSRNASRIIEAIDGGKVQNGTETQRDALKGHAIALRAMAHFDQVKIFGYPYAKDKGQSWGAIIIDHVLADDELPLRSTVDRTFEFITSELERAIPMMSTEKNAYNMMNAYGARALLARAYLYWEKNDKAFSTASRLIEDLEPNEDYRLWTRSEYAGAWAYNSTGTNYGPESLLEIFNTPSDNPGRNGYSYMSAQGGYGAVLFTGSFRDFIREDPDDIRNTIVRYGNGYPFLNKYAGDGASAAFDNNYPLIRLSEVYLIAAEAAVKAATTENRAKGLEYLNDIVQRANPDNEVTDAKYTLDRVLDERRRELVGEGHRYFDLLRNGKTVQRIGDYHHWYPAATSMTINWDYKYCVMPVPTDQFDLNPELKSQQNPGYPTN